MFARLLFFAALTFASPFLARAESPAPLVAQPVATASAVSAPEPVATPDCGVAGVYVAPLNSCLQVASASAWQVNLVDGSVNRLALLVGVALVHRDAANLGIGFYCGAGLSSTESNAGQCDLLLSALKFGAVGIGSQIIQRNGKAVYQGLFTLGVHLPTL